MFIAKMTPRAGALTSTSTVQVDTSPRDLHIMDQPHNESSPRQHMDQSYGGQKVLTPTKFRETPASEPNSPRREYGVQTGEYGVQTCEYGVQTGKSNWENFNMW